MKTRWSRLTMMITVLAVLAGAAACTSGGSGEETTAAGRADLESPDFGAQGAPETTVAAAETPAPEADGAFAERDRLGSGGIEPVVFQTSDFGRDIIFTADLTVAVNDVAAAGEEATRLIRGLGGLLFGQQTTANPEPYSILVFKVLPEDFQAALARLGSIGELRTQNVSADDVTEKIVDLESRINTAAASVERLRTLLEGAGEIKTIVELENELLARETQLETLRGQLRTLQEQVALATIVLTLTEAESRPAVIVDVSAYPGQDGGLSCPGEVGLTVDQGGQATVCYEITNAGDTLLKGFEVRDPVLDIETADLVVVFGEPAGTIEPGESIVLAAEIVAERNYRLQTTVTAIPVDEDGNPLPRRSVSTTATMFLEAVDPGGIPTFREGLQASWELLLQLGRWLILAAGALLPFVWAPVLVWLLWRLVRGRRNELRPAGEVERATPSDG